MFIEVIKKEFMQSAVYRANSILGIIGTVLQLVIQVSLWRYLTLQSAGGVSFDQMATYIVVTMVVTAFTDLRTCDDLGDKVYDGSVSIDLLRPYDLKRYMLAQSFGGIFYRLVFTVAPVVLVTALILRAHFACGPVEIISFVIALVNASLLMFYLQYLLGLTAFWLQKIWFMRFFVDGLLALLGGSMIPIWFYPGWLDAISQALPFRYMMFEPANLLINGSPQSCLRVLVIQFAWLLAFFLFERLVWSRAERRTFINGG